MAMNRRSYCASTASRSGRVISKLCKDSQTLAVFIWVIIFCVMAQTSTVNYRLAESVMHQQDGYSGIRDISFEESVLVCEQSVDRVFDSDPTYIPMDEECWQTIRKPMNLSSREEDLLERIAFFEAGSEGIDGMRRVVDVVLNRLYSDKFPNTIEDVLMQEGQFESVKGWRFFNARIPESARAAVKKETNGCEQLDNQSLYFARTPLTANGVYRYGKHYFSY